MDVVGGYSNRREAGERLAVAVAAVLPRTGEKPLILALPRGGVPVAAEIASVLNGELDVLVARKIGAPHNPELALGAVCAEGPAFLNQTVIRSFNLDHASLVEAVTVARAEAQRRLVQYRKEKSPLLVTGRTVVVVDDGLATGATMHAALNAVREEQPERLIAAVPVGAVDAVRAIGEMADEVVCPLAVTDLTAVGAWYRDFRQLTDEEVLKILAQFE